MRCNAPRTQKTWQASGKCCVLSVLPPADAADAPAGVATYGSLSPPWGLSGEDAHTGDGKSPEPSLSLPHCHTRAEPGLAAARLAPDTICVAMLTDDTNVTPLRIERKVH